MDVYFTDILLTGSDSNDFSLTTTCPVNGTALAPGTSCTSTIYFRPSVVEAGSAIQVYEGNFPEQSGLIMGEATAVLVKPKALSFPKTMVGTTTVPKTATFTNVGSSALPITSISWSGSEPYFSQTNTCGSSVPAHSSCTFSITFSPLTAGTFSATLSIGDPDPGGPQKIMVGGVGVNGSDTN